MYKQQTAEVTKADLDSLNAKIVELREKYRPGLGEIMSVIQMHHAKLWFAGINANWKLSLFELDEIREMLQFATDVETDRPEVKEIPMIVPELDSVGIAIERQDIDQFKNRFQLLTNTCNNCHKEVNFEFNVIKIPTEPPVTNQEFKVSK